MENQGYWIRHLIRNEKGGCIGAKMFCSKCNQTHGFDIRFEYCPMCGKKMDCSIRKQIDPLKENT